MDLREHLEMRDRAHALGANSGQVFELLRLVDRYGVATVLGWLRARPADAPDWTCRFLADLLAAGLTAERFAWLTRRQYGGPLSLRDGGRLDD